jgi:hypothetical protein
LAGWGGGGGGREMIRNGNFTANSMTGGPRRISWSMRGSGQGQEEEKAAEAEEEAQVPGVGAYTVLYESEGERDFEWWWGFRDAVSINALHCGGRS